MAGLHQCPVCGYRFESDADLIAHEELGLGCPETGGPDDTGGM